LFCEAIRTALLHRDSNQLAGLLTQIHFEPSDAFLIAAAVALTRNLPLPRAEAFSGLVIQSDWQKRAIDALAVTFMFNIVNRIANAFELVPEWNSVGHTDWFRSRMHAIMSFGLPMLMPLDYDPQEPVPCSAPFIEQLLHEFGIDHPSGIWQQLGALPTVEFAIYRLLWVGVHCCETDQRTIEKLLCAQEDEDAERAAGRRNPFWKERVDAPYLRPQDVATLCKGTDEGTKVDLAFRVALLAGTNTLNSSAAAELVENPLAVKA
jgi:hypothetical protein